MQPAASPRETMTAASKKRYIEHSNRLMFGVAHALRRRANQTDDFSWAPIAPQGLTELAGYEGYARCGKNFNRGATRDRYSKHGVDHRFR